MATLNISATSLVYVRVPVYATVSGNAYNPTSDTVQMGFSQTVSSPATWNAASWETDNSTVDPTYLALCLVGPGGTVTLVPGDYTVWVRVTDNPEIPVMPAGKLTVTQ